MARSLERLTQAGPKRILALDGGGVRGAMTCAVLERMEAALRARLPEAQQDSFRLCDYFDLIGGTSTGAIIAAWLALGHTARETRELYETLAQEVFSHGPLFGGLSGEEVFDSKRFMKITDKVFAEFGAQLGFDKEHAPNTRQPGAQNRPRFVRQAHRQSLALDRAQPPEWEVLGSDQLALGRLLPGLGRYARHAKLFV